jgi:hypothetical protein
MNCTDYSLSKLYTSQMQLISAWLNRDETILEFELGAAAARVGAKVLHMLSYSHSPVPADSHL